MTIKRVSIAFTRVGKQLPEKTHENSFRVTCLPQTSYWIFGNFSLTMAVNMILTSTLE